jgi:hypothetical protein
MATKKKADPAPEEAAAPLNREQRRAQKFGRAGKVHQHDPLGPWPESDVNPALRTAGPDDATAGRPDQGQTDLTGPGTGGATQQPDRQPHHEGAHPGTRPKG